MLKEPKSQTLWAKSIAAEIRDDCLKQYGGDEVLWVLAGKGLEKGYKGISGEVLHQLKVTVLLKVTPKRRLP